MKPINDISGEIVDAGFQVHTELGPGLLESVYEVVLASELTARGFHVERQVAVPIRFRGREFDEAFRADLIVERRIIVEIKSIEKLHPVHKKQVLTYLKLTGLQLGLLLNFGETYFKDGIVRLVNNLAEERT